MLRMKTASSPACGLHAQPIAEDRAARERAGRIDGDDADGRAGARECRESAGRRACSCQRRAAGHADQKRAAGPARRSARTRSAPAGVLVFDRAKSRARSRAGRPASTRSASEAVTPAARRAMTSR